MARKLYPTSKKVCDCNAEYTALTTVQPMRRGTMIRHSQGMKVQWEIKKSQQVFHRRGDMYFWHWKDQDAVVI